MARTSRQRSTTAPTPSGPADVVVVDGSNIATEGRSVPSLEQLDEAVKAFIEEYPEAAITVVVDATFGHRIDKREVKGYDAAVANNELVTPPAGAVGRGDAFVLSIADKVGARVLSNDSFQEFHGDYPWLFEDGRLIGGKPVPNIGWVFVERVPVKGPRSRQSQRTGNTRSSSKSRSAPAPAKTSRKDGAAPAAIAASAGASRTSSRSKAAPEAVNDTLPFLEFVERHPIGTSVNVEVESYASHGAYVKVGDVRAYVPLSLMDDPAPTSARKVMSIGEALTFVVASYSPARRSIDLAAPHMLPAVEPPGTDEEPPATKPRATAATRNATATTAKRAAAKTATAAADEKPAAKKSTARKATAKTSTAKKSTAKKAASSSATTKKSAAAKQPTAKKSTAKRSTSTTSPPDTDAATQAAPSTAPPEQKPAAAKTTTRKTAAKKSTAKKSTAKKSTAKKSSSAAGNATTKKTPTSGSRRSRSTTKGDDS